MKYTLISTHIVSNSRIRFITLRRTAVLIVFTLGSFSSWADEGEDTAEPAPVSPYAEQINLANAKKAYFEVEKASSESRKAAAEAKAAELATLFGGMDDLGGESGQTTLNTGAGFVGKLLSHRAAHETGSKLGESLGKAVGNLKPGDASVVRIYLTADTAMAGRLAALTVFQARISSYEEAVNTLQTRIRTLNNDVTDADDKTAQQKPLYVQWKNDAAVMITTYDELKDREAKLGNALSERETGVAGSAAGADPKFNDEPALQSVSAVLTAIPLVLGAVDGVASLFRSESTLSNIEVTSNEMAFWASVAAESKGLFELYVPGMHDVPVNGNSDLLTSITTIGSGIVARRTDLVPVVKKIKEMADDTATKKVRSASVQTSATKGVETAKGFLARAQKLSNEELIAKSESLVSEWGKLAKSSKGVVDLAAEVEKLISGFTVRQTELKTKLDTISSTFESYVAAAVAVGADGSSPLANLFVAEAIKSLGCSHFLFLKLYDQGAESVVKSRWLRNDRVAYYGGAAGTYILTEIKSGKIVASGNLETLMRTDHQPGESSILKVRTLDFDQPIKK